MEHFNLDDSFAHFINERMFVEGCRPELSVPFSKSKPRGPNRKFKTDMTITHRSTILKEFDLKPESDYSNSKLLDILERPEDVLVTGKCPVTNSDYSNDLIDCCFEDSEASRFKEIIETFPELDPLLSLKETSKGPKHGNFDSLVTANVSYSFFPSFVGKHLDLKKPNDVKKYFSKSVFCNQQNLKKEGKIVLVCPFKEFTAGKLFIEKLETALSTSLDSIGCDSVYLFSPPVNFIKLAKLSNYTSEIKTLMKDSKTHQVYIFTKKD